MDQPLSPCSVWPPIESSSRTTCSLPGASRGHERSGRGKVPAAGCAAPRGRSSGPAAGRRLRDCGRAGGEPAPPVSRPSSALRLKAAARALPSLVFALTPRPPSSEIEAIKLAEQKRQAERRRRATAVVGDLQPLRDALPELLELEAGARRPPARRRVASKPRPAELSRMTAAQRLQLLEEERARFRELLASPAYRASPLLAIGQQLAQQMQLDGGQL